jgi:hypothetical protein
LITWIVSIASSYSIPMFCVSNISSSTIRCHNHEAGKRAEMLLANQP